MVELGELFTNTRFPPGLMFVLMVLYFPIGIFLIVCRVLIAIHTYLIVCLLPKSSARRQTVRVMLGVLGIHVIVDEDKSDERHPAKVLVSNNTSVLDHIIIDVLINNIVPYEGGVPAIFQWVLGYKDFGSSRGKEKFLENMKAHCQSSNIPLFLQPEGAPTNNTVGLLKFSSLAFELELPIQPIAIQVSRFSFPCALTTVESPKWTDVLWCFFTPVTVFNIKILPLEEKQETENVEEFTERIQSKIAEALRLQTTEFTAADKAEYMKKLKQPPPVQRQGNFPMATKEHTSNGGAQSSTAEVLSSVNEEMRQMIQQVRDVLPQVPCLAIKQDLEITQDIDITISNILEGRVIYSPEELNTVEEDRSRCASSLELQNNSPLFKASSFARSPYDRHLSLAERKQAMLELARQRYKEKHGLL